MGRSPVINNISINENLKLNDIVSQLENLSFDQQNEKFCFILDNEQINVEEEIKQV